MSLAALFVLAALTTEPATFTEPTAPVAGIEASASAEETLSLSDGSIIVAALEAELERGMSLRMEDLPPPYHVSYSVREMRMVSVSAAWGALLDSSDGHWRTYSTQVRVGSPELDNTNFTGGRSGFVAGGQLPVEDDVHALRHALWLSTDSAYKQAVEALTAKLAYMKDKSFEERAPDFIDIPVVQERLPVQPVRVDRARLEDTVRRISARFLLHPMIQEAGVGLTVEVGQRILVDSAGMRLVTPECLTSLRVSASLQAPDGFRLQDGLFAWADEPGGLPPVEEIEAAIDALVARLIAVGEAEKLESYTGPVLFAGSTGPAVLQAMLAGGLASEPEPVGRVRASTTLERKIGQRILPRTFRAWDDPTATVHDAGPAAPESVPLAGHYVYDHEGVRARRVDLVESGKLLATVMGRTPTRRQSGSTGHARASGWYGAPRPGISNLFFEDTAPVTEDELLDELRSAAVDEGLEFGLLVTQFSGRTVGDGSGTSQVRLPDPLVFAKVYADDGRIVPVQRAQFAPADPKTLKRLIAAGDVLYLHEEPDAAGGTAVIGPALLFEELELSAIEQELDKLPLVAGPLQRD